MKKYFKFAVVAVAGMLASCSSESLTGSDPEIKTPDQEELVPIEIGVATNEPKAITRGTGTVGGIDDGTNKWKGEKVNVLMYKINADGTPTFEFAKDGSSNNLYDASISLVTPLETENKSTGIAKVINLGDPYTNPGVASYKVKYYPATGRYDFWGFYLGGGATRPSDALPATPDLEEVKAKYDGAESAPNTNNARAVAFTLDGTMDLMVAKAATGDGSTGAAISGEAFETAQTSAVEAKTTDESKRPAVYNASYSAKAARGGLQPELVFKHALTRLTFKVKAGDDDAVDVKVKAIKVHSMTKGKLVVAYDYTQGKISANNSIIWDGTSYNPTTDFTDGTYQTDTYTALELKERSAGAMVDLNTVTLTNSEVATPKAIGEALLVAPQKKYWIEVEYDASAVSAEKWNTPHDPVGDPSSVNPAPITADIARTNPSDVFEAGKSYNITITLYGPQKIQITTTLDKWTNVDEEITVTGD